MGELAALLTSFCWAGSGIFFTAAGKKVGSMSVNRIRLLLALVLFLIAHLIIEGSLIPLDAGRERWFWLALSGIVGLVISDSLLFQAYVLIGVRIPVLTMAGVPVISSIIAWIFLGERLSLGVITGIAVAISGIMVVVAERGEGNLVADNRRNYIVGILCGFGAAAGQAAGLVLAKQGMAGDYSTLSSVTIRSVVAFATIWMMALLSGQARLTFLQMLRIPAAFRNVAAGTVIGPFIGVWMSMFAVQMTYVGVASTLMALSPVILLPVIKFGYKEYVSRQAVFGTVITIIGVALIFILS